MLKKETKPMRKQQLVIVRGGGDIATGIVQKLYRSGFGVVILETEKPSAIRRQVALSEAVYEGISKVEDMTCRRCENFSAVQKIIAKGEIPLLVDPQGKSLEKVKPWAVVDAILAKRNLGTTRTMAPKTIGVGPGFTAGVDVDLVVETMRGHNLGRLILEGSAEPNTGVPGLIAGYGAERVIHAPVSGKLKHLHKIGDLVEEGEPIAAIVTAKGEISVPASLTGLLRGLLRAGYQVSPGFKIADIDPRKDQLKNCFTISDKARCIGGAVLEGLLYLEEQEE